MYGEAHRRRVRARVKAHRRLKRNLAAIDYFLTVIWVLAALYVIAAIVTGGRV